MRHRILARDAWFRRIGLWWPTWRLWLLLLLVAVVAAGWCAHSVHRFLCVSRPIKAEVLVVEGWISDSGLRRVVREAEEGRYARVVTGGGPLSQGSFLVPYGTYAALTAESLRSVGLDAGLVWEAPAPDAKRNRTYETAVAVRRFLERSGWRVHGINVVSEGPHARRTWAVYQRVFANGPPVGVIALPPPDYDGAAWWESSEGVKQTLVEGLGWLYEAALGGGR